MQFLTAPAFFAGMILSLSLIMAIGPQNAHVMRMGLLRQHLWLTVGVCVLTDAVLIALGVAGLAQLGGLSDKLLGAMTGDAECNQWQALQRFLKPAGASPGDGPTDAGNLSRRKAIGTALAFSWLNPHAWLDTAVVMGTASLAYAQPDNLVFGAGAMTGSLLWFTALGIAMALLGRRLNSPAVWRALDLVVAFMMWGTAFWLMRGLL
ncbi:MAG: lysine transporter LysE [Haliea sp.]|nr:MAG: lysine transporter LysE [Haliea sp.]